MINQQEIAVTAENLKSAVKGFKALFGYEPSVRTIGIFKDTHDDTCFGSCEVLKIGNKLITFEADGNHYKAEITAVTRYILK